MGEALEALGINGPFLLSQIINFLILFVILRVFLWKPLMQQIEDRRQMLEKEEADAEALARARSNIEAERARILDKARGEAEKIIADGREQVRAMKDRVLQEAQQEKEAILNEARQDAEEERNHILGEMRGQIAALSTAAAQKIIGETLDEQRQRALVDSFFSGVRAGRVEVLPADMERIDGPAIVTSALPLTDAEQDIIRQELVSRLGKEVELAFRVEPQILGGLVVRVGDQVVDGSVSGQLEQLQKSLI